MESGVQGLGVWSLGLTDWAQTVPGFRVQGVRSGVSGLGVWSVGWDLGFEGLEFRTDRLGPELLEL